jgi:hypothetical protein
VRKEFPLKTSNEIDMMLNKRHTDSLPSLKDMRIGRAKEVLSKWMGGENLDIAAKEIVRLVKFEIDLKAYNETPKAILETHARECHLTFHDRLTFLKEKSERGMLWSRDGSDRPYIS